MVVAVLFMYLIWLSFWICWSLFDINGPFLLADGIVTLRFFPGLATILWWACWDFYFASGDISRTEKRFLVVPVDFFSGSLDSWFHFWLLSSSKRYGYPFTITLFSCILSQSFVLLLYHSNSSWQRKIKGWCTIYYICVEFIMLNASRLHFLVQCMWFSNRCENYISSNPR